jgi:hypothetical protein
MDAVLPYPVNLRMVLEENATKIYILHAWTITNIVLQTFTANHFPLHAYYKPITHDPKMARTKRKVQTHPNVFRDVSRASLGNDSNFTTASAPEEKGLP